MGRKKLIMMKEWKDLKKHFAEMKDASLKMMFESDKARVKKFSINDGDILFDYSKNIINEKTVNLLIDLANARRLKDEIENMFSGKKINVTEKRAVLHVALRNISRIPVYVGRKNVMPEVFAVIEKMKVFSEKVRSGE